MNLALEQNIATYTGYDLLGCIAFYDGQYNLGTGQCDYHSLVWNDLMEKSPSLSTYPVHDFGEYGWTGDGFSLSTTQWMYVNDCGPIAYSANNSDGFSFECSVTECKLNSDTGYFGIFGICSQQYEYSNKYIGVVYINRNSNYRVCMIDDNNLRQISHPQGFRHICGCMDRVNKRMITYFDGQHGVVTDLKKTLVVGNGLQIKHIQSSYFNGSGVNNNYTKIHTLRFYDRLLTPEQIYRNYVIDKRRFVK